MFPGRFISLDCISAFQDHDNHTWGKTPLCSEVNTISYRNYNLSISTG